MICSMLWMLFDEMEMKRRLLQSCMRPSFIELGRHGCLADMVIAPCVVKTAGNGYFCTTSSAWNAATTQRNTHHGCNCGYSDRGAWLNVGLLSPAGRRGRQS